MQLQSTSHVPSDKSIRFILKPQVFPKFIFAEAIAPGRFKYQVPSAGDFWQYKYNQTASSQSLEQDQYENIHQIPVSIDVIDVEELRSSFNKIEFEILNGPYETSRASLDEPVAVLAESLARKVHFLCSLKNEKAEDRAVDFLFDFFVDNIAESNYSLVDDGLKCLSPHRMTDTCLLTAMHLTDQCKEYLTARKAFYDQAYQIIEKNNGRDTASELLDDLR